jgi:hypothetical protein
MLFMCSLLCSYNVAGVPVSPDGCIIGKVHLTPLTSVTLLIPLLNVEDQEEFFHSVLVGTMFIPYKTTADLYSKQCNWFV